MERKRKRKEKITIISKQRGRKEGIDLGFLPSVRIVPKGRGKRKRWEKF